MNLDLDGVHLSLIFVSVGITSAPGMQLSFFETQVELANFLPNLTNLPNSVKVRSPSNVSKFKT